MYFTNCETLELMMQTIGMVLEQLCSIFLFMLPLYLSTCPPLLLSCTSKTSNSRSPFHSTLLSLVDVVVFILLVM